MYSGINIEKALKLGWPLVDVRSPGEFSQGHIPGAVNIPLFSDEERAAIGKVYKQQSEEKAIELGYRFVNPKLNDFITVSRELAPDGKLIVHCWRGGMRSNSFAGHLSDNGFADVKVINGGYKSYRHFISEYLASEFDIRLLGGYTGSGKTYILHKLEKLGHQVIDLEGLAHHKGSAFGAIGQQEQPTTEQFGNLLYESVSKLNPAKPIWIEDENINIGRVEIPESFFAGMQASRLYFIDIPKEERAKHLVSEYTNCDVQLLKDSVSRISKRLGGQNAKMATELLEAEKYYEVALITLSYYDKAYLKVKYTHEDKDVVHIPLERVEHFENALKIEKYL